MNKCDVLYVKITSRVINEDDVLYIQETNINTYTR